jgi:5-(carboxyamino)imidazole ribonucleotide synthase
VPYAAINTIEDLEAAIKTIGLPAVLKTAGFGYDGKGQRMIKAMSDVDADKVPALPAIIEKFIPFKKEISIIGARSENGKFAAHGPIENQHQNHILDVSFAPAVVSPVVIEQALAITQKVMEGLNVIGLLCVEFFLMQDDTLLINELAPRPHNSGHLTIESCAASQFEQLVRTVTGLPLGSTVQNHAAAMANLLGDVWNNGEPKWSAALSLPDVHLHLYGKEQPRPGRKMGHIAACASTVEQAKAQVIEARSLLCK